MDDAAFAARLERGDLARVRFLDHDVATEPLLRAAHRAGVTAVVQPVLANGRIELPRWLREQALSITRHRHGNIRPTRARSGG
jgi:RHH-type proline utilization regulon transcriptional repressor/proline dehydrogenase/delta 1-pyrroline-5-carboxylate dehydrogenase